MRINVYSTGFDLTAHTRSFAESRVRSALRPFTVLIASAAVQLDVRRGGPAPDDAMCSMVVRLRPSGEIRSQAEHPWLHVAIDRAAATIDAEVLREILHRRSAARGAACCGRTAAIVS
jgi:ribosome-associated translation inhibitor RaiA